MKLYLMILDFERDFSKTIGVYADDRADAFCKASKYCKQEGYFPINVRLIENAGIDYINKKC